MRKISQIFVALEKLTFTFNQWGQSLKFHTISFHKIFSIFSFQKFQFITKTILETNINVHIVRRSFQFWNSVAKCFTVWKANVSLCYVWLFFKRLYVIKRILEVCSMLMHILNYICSSYHMWLHFFAFKIHILGFLRYSDCTTTKNFPINHVCHSSAFGKHLSAKNLEH